MLCILLCSFRCCVPPFHSYRAALFTHLKYFLIPINMHIVALHNTAKMTAVRSLGSKVCYGGSAAEMPERIFGANEESSHSSKLLPSGVRGVFRSIVAGLQRLGRPGFESYLWDEYVLIFHREVSFIRLGQLLRSGESRLLLLASISYVHHTPCSLCSTQRLVCASIRISDETILLLK